MSAGSTCELVKIEVVARAIQIRRHRGDEIAAVLATIGLTQPDSGNLGDGVRLVRRLERTAQQILFADRLRAISRIDARAAQVKQTLDAVHPARLRDGGVNHQVVVDELRRARGVGENAADRARDQEDVLGLVRLEPVVHRRLIAQIELVSRGAEDIGEPGRIQTAHDRGTDQATMSRDIDRGIARDLMCRHWSQVYQSVYTCARFRPTRMRCSASDQRAFPRPHAL